MTVREFKSTKNYVTDKYETGIVWRKCEICSHYFAA